MSGTFPASGAISFSDMATVLDDPAPTTMPSLAMAKALGQNDGPWNIRDLLGFYNDTDVSFKKTNSGASGGSITVRFFSHSDHATYSLSLSGQSSSVSATVKTKSSAPSLGDAQYVFTRYYWDISINLLSADANATVTLAFDKGAGAVYHTININIS